MSNTIAGSVKNYSLLRQTLLSRPFEEFNPCRRLLEIAENTNSSLSSNGMFSKITLGQIAGGVFVLFGAVSAALTSFAQDKAKWMFSTIFYAALGLVGITVGSLGRKGFIESKHNRLIKNLEELPIDKSASWDDVVMEKSSDREELQRAAIKVLKQGIVISVLGPPGTGKSFTANRIGALLRENQLLKQEGVEEVVVFRLNKDLIEKGFEDKGVKEVWGIKFGDGSIGQKLEGIFTYLADLHRKSNGKKVFVVIAEEGHELLGSASGSSSAFSRENVHSQLAELFDRQANPNSFRGELGKGVVFVVTHNSRENEQHEHLERRTDKWLSMKKLSRAKNVELIDKKSKKIGVVLKSEQLETLAKQCDTEETNDTGQIELKTVLRPDAISNEIENLVYELGNSIEVNNYFTKLAERLKSKKDAELPRSSWRK